MSIMDALTNSSTTEANRKRVQERVWRLLGALIGACGFGGSVDRTISDFQHAGEQSRWVAHALLGTMFLLIAIVNSHLLLSRTREGEQS